LALNVNMHRALNRFPRSKAFRPLYFQYIGGFEPHRLRELRETKSSTAPDDLRDAENQKIHCGERFTDALGVDYRVSRQQTTCPNRGARAASSATPTFSWFFEARTGLYWSSSRVLEYMQQIQGDCPRCPSGIGPMRWSGLGLRIRAHRSHTSKDHLWRNTQSNFLHGVFKWGISGERRLQVRRPCDKSLSASTLALPSVGRPVATIPS